MGAGARVALDPEDWFRATWRNAPPLVRPAAPTFDPRQCLERLAKVPPAPSYTEEWTWARARLAPALSREEAAFWLHAMLGASQESQQPAQLARKWAVRPPTSPLEPAELRKALGRHRCPPPEIWIPLFSLYSAIEAVDQVLRFEAETDDLAAQGSWYRMAAFVSLSRGFRRHVLPYLTEAERDELRAIVRPRLDLSAWPQLTHGPVPVPLLLASALGFHDEMRTLCHGLSPADELHGQLYDVLFGLGSPAEVIAERDRLNLPLDRTTHIRSWLAHTELGALEPVRAAIVAEKRKGRATPLIGALGLARGPETAAVMLDLISRSKAPDAARAWLLRHTGISIPAMVEAAGGRGNAAAAAVSLLRSLAGRGHETEIVGALEAVNAPVRVREALLPPGGSAAAAALPAWFTSAAGELKAVNAPGWIVVRDVPPVTLDREPLPEDGVVLLLAALSKSTLAEPHPLVAAVRAKADPHLLDRFAWRLYELWKQHGMKGKETWALAATGLLGSDGCALKLGPLARELRTALRHQPAALALECLKAIGTDTALLQLRNFTRIPREWSLKETARQHLEAIAAARGLSPEQLEDRMVPVCGLDERGSCVYDYGPRSFTLVMGPGIKPSVRDEAGRLRELPKPGAKDDPARAPAAYAAWGVLKKQLTDVVRMQTRRLESAMVDGRRWSAAEFEEVLVRHPVMTHFARGLVWGVYSPADALEATFRVAEDQSYAGPNDEPFSLASDAQVGLPHVLTLTPELAVQWGERFGDYVITAPFAQLGRPASRVEPAEVTETEIRRFAGIPCLAVALVDGLERRNWRHEGGGSYSTRFLRPFPGARVTAVLEVAPGFAIWDLRSAGDQTIESVSFHPAAHGGQAQDRIPLGQVDFIVFSEVVCDLSALTRRI